MCLTAASGCSAFTAIALCFIVAIARCGERWDMAECQVYAAISLTLRIPLGRCDGRWDTQRNSREALTGSHLLDMRNQPDIAWARQFRS